MQRTCTAPCFCSPLFKSSSWVFWSLRIFCPEFAPAAYACSYFQSHSVSSYFVALEEVCPGASIAALQHRAPGPRRLTSPTSTVRSVVEQGTQESPGSPRGQDAPGGVGGVLVLKMAVSAGRAFLPSPSRLSHLLPPIVQVASATRKV